MFPELYEPFAVEDVTERTLGLWLLFIVPPSTMVVETPAQTEELSIVVLSIIELHRLEPFDTVDSFLIVVLSVTVEDSTVDPPITVEFPHIVALSIVELSIFELHMYDPFFTFDLLSIEELTVLELSMVDNDMVEFETDVQLVR